MVGAILAFGSPRNQNLIGIEEQRRFVDKMIGPKRKHHVPMGRYYVTIIPTGTNPSRHQPNKIKMRIFLKEQMPSASFHHDVLQEQWLI
jgi:hypothetical protein